MYRLTIANSIEEKIVDLQNKKRELAEQAIEGGMKKNAFKLGLNEIIDLFKPSHTDSAAPVERQEVPGLKRDGLMRSGKPNGPAKRQESEIYGRRW